MSNPSNLPKTKPAVEQQLLEQVITLKFLLRCETTSATAEEIKDGLGNVHIPKPGRTEKLINIPVSIK